MKLERITPSAATMRGVERWVRRFTPRSMRRSPPVPRVLGGLGLALAGAAAALLLSPKTGREMRGITRRRFAALHRTALALKNRGVRPGLRNGRATSARPGARDS
ncbi:MAG TPA: hypothetical protein VKF60_03645 [Myxococcota bacterium]|nr:hypothetical protein [Myxococcota bacterium]